MLAGLEFDCACRERLDTALLSFMALEEKRRRRQAMLGARHERDTIVVLLALLNEVNEIGVNEPDTTVFDEMAQLFEDIAEAAKRGAAEIREASDVPPAADVPAPLRTRRPA